MRILLNSGRFEFTLNDFPRGAQESNALPVLKHFNCTSVTQGD
jgi:hypothetical protein